VRKEGLIWVIKCIWLLGEDVHLVHMPPFLDSQCMEFLLDYARDDIMRVELHQLFVSFKVKARDNRVANVIKQKTLNYSLRNQSMEYSQESPMNRLSFFDKSVPQEQTNTSIQKGKLFEKKTQEELMNEAREKLH